MQQRAGIARGLAASAVVEGRALHRWPRRSSRTQVGLGATAGHVRARTEGAFAARDPSMAEAIC